LATTSSFTSIEQLQKQLRQKFVVVGDNARMHASLCVIMIRYTGGWIPPQCDCTTQDDPRLQKQDISHRQLSVQLFRVHGHGVRHHGSSCKTTPAQDAWMDQLTQEDQLLYQAAQVVYPQQSLQVEEDYQIRICES
jgi:hypothetical protein